MDDAFEFRAEHMPRRRIDPLAMKAGVIAGLLVAAIGVFAKVAIDSERRSLHTGEAPAVVVSTIDGVEAPEATVIGGTPITVDPELDRRARDSAEAALSAARAVLRADGTLDAAGPLQLASIDTGLIFVDGPSSVSEVVSVAGSASVWAAAVMSDSGTCFYVRVTSQRHVSYGTGTSCTGQAALGAGERAWPLLPATP